MRFFRNVLNGGDGVFNGLSRVLEIDVHYFMRGGFWIGLSYAFHTLMRLVLVVFLARFFDKQFYGQYQFVMGILAIVVFFSLPGMETSITQSVANGYKSSLVYGTRSKLKWSFLGSLVLLGFAGFFSFVKPEPFWDVFVFAALIFPLYSGFTGVSGYFRGREDFRKAAFYDMLVELVGIAAIIAASFTRSLFMVFLVYMILASLVKLSVFLVVRKGIAKGAVDSGVVAYGRDITFMGVFNYISPYLDRVVVAFVVGFEALAVYTIALAVVPYLTYGARLFSLLLLPKFSRESPSHVRKVKKLFWWFCLGFAVVVGLLVVVLPWIIPLLFSEKYADSVFFAQIACIYLVFFLPSSIIYSYFQGRKRVRLLYVYNIGLGVLNVLLLFVLIPLLGVMGALVSKIALGVLGFMFLVMAFYRKP
jgi:O-antigen/teichoic acid export membrane protein